MARLWAHACLRSRSWMGSPRPSGSIARKPAPSSTAAWPQPGPAARRVADKPRSFEEDFTMPTLLRRVLIGAPLPTHRAKHERLTKFIALPVFASDAISSCAYATEEILFALLL